VSEGWGVAYARYSRDYIDEEMAARGAKRGLWRGTFMPPWQWRGKRGVRPRGDLKTVPFQAEMVDRTSRFFR
jgi:endonuclease YncB( thermonuclease family)